MARYVFDINRPAGLLNPNGGETGPTLLNGLNNNSLDQYLGSGGLYIIQESDDISDADWWTEKIASYKTFSIVSDYDFGGATVVLPDGVVLLFNGGIWSNGIITGANTALASYGIQQCFDTDLTLSGTWKLDYITPQHYGAKTNASTTLTTNDSTAAIQKCFDSIFPVFIPAGLYYVSSLLTFTVANKIVRSIPGGTYYDGAVTSQLNTRIYTDQDIDVFAIRTTGLKILDGLTLDISPATTYSHSVILFDCNYWLGAPQIKATICGSLSKLRSGAITGNGIYANLDVTTTPGLGELFCEVRILIFPISVEDYTYRQRTGAENSFFSLYEIKGAFVGNKQDIVAIYGSECKIECDGQSIPALLAEEYPLYGFYLNISNSFINIQLSDYDEGLVGGYYASKHMYVEGSANQFGFLCQDYYTNIVKSISQPFSGFIENPSNFLISNPVQNSVGRGISALDNQFAFLKQSVPDTEIVLYDGAAYDFDTKLDSSAGEGLGSPLSLEIWGGHGVLTDLFKARTNPPYFIFANDNDGLDTDFLEVVIPVTGSAMYGETTILNAFISASNCMFNRIQVILKYADTEVVNNYYYTANNFIQVISLATVYQLVVGGLQKMIIRFIGSTDVHDGTNFIRIHELYSKGWENLYPPQIDIGGDQTIYGNLAVNDGVKEVDLPVYADNAAAKVGGLVAGDPYRTATGVRMVVYD